MERKSKVKRKDSILYLCHPWNMPSNAYIQCQLTCQVVWNWLRGRMTEVSRGRANAATLHNIVCKSKNITRHDLSSSVPTRPGASSACVPVGGGWPWWLLDSVAMALRLLGWGQYRESQSEGDRRRREVYIWTCGCVCGCMLMESKVISSSLSSSSLTFQHSLTTSLLCQVPLAYLLTGICRKNESMHVEV